MDPSTCPRHPQQPAYIVCQRCERPICPQCMVEASVGFQCPECVAAAPAPRPQAAFGGARVANPRLTTLVLMVVNILVWAAIVATGQGASPLLDLLGISPSGRCAATDGTGGWFPRVPQERCTAAGMQWLPGVASGAWWQLLTSAFTHVSPAHLGANMLTLWFLGPSLETVLGRARYLALYLVSALAGSTVVMWLAAPRGLTVGASGAIFGLMGALLLVAWKRGGDVRTVLTWVGINAFVTVVGGSMISWQGHLGGFLSGLAVTAILMSAPRGPRRTAAQWAGIAGLTIVCLALVAVRALTLS